MAVKFSICNELFKGWSLKKVIEYISRIGYEGVEIAPFTISYDIRHVSKNERSEIHEIAERYGVEVVGTHWLLVTPPGLHITHPDENVRKLTVKYLIALVKFTADIGGKIMVFGSPKQRNILPGVDERRAWEWATGVFKEVCKVAEDHGVTICMEPLSRDQTNFVNTAKEATVLIEKVNSPNFQLILDVRSMFDEELSHSEIIKSYGKYLAHFHANDDNGLGPGFGRANYHKIAKALDYVNYRGYVSVEVFDFSLGAKYIAERSIVNLIKYFR